MFSVWLIILKNSSLRRAAFCNVVNRHSNEYLARGHVNALKAIQDNCGLVLYNLGTGKGYSVLELVEAFERVNGIKIPYVIDGRRAGDVPVVYSDPSKAERELGWRAEYGINEMVRDSWNWQKRNPNGARWDTRRKKSNCYGCCLDLHQKAKPTSSHGITASKRKCRPKGRLFHAFTLRSR